MHTTCDTDEREHVCTHEHVCTPAHKSTGHVTLTLTSVGGEEVLVVVEVHGQHHRRHVGERVGWVDELGGHGHEGWVTGVGVVGINAQQRAFAIFIIRVRFFNE